MNDAALGQPDRLHWFRQAKFGMFIHWGIYALQRNGEWVMNADSISVQDYHALAKQFLAERFDADAWARSAKRAGMRYMVLTTKHHDGFCLWNTKTTRFNAVRVGPRRDVVRAFVDACRRHDIRVGLYWSWVDWNYPDWAKQFIWTDLNQWRQPLPGPKAHDRMVEYLHGQVRELMTNYGKIDVFWFDGGFLTAEQYRSRELVDEMRRLQPQILINDRAGFPGDFGSPEGLMPTEGSDRAWELCHCTTASTTWTSPLDDPALFASPSELLGLLCDAAALGGNLLLNFGPQADGTFPPSSVEQLRVIGSWMRRNAEAIRGTLGGPTGRQDWGVSTRKGNTLYLHIFRPAPRLAIRCGGVRPRRARILASNRSVHFTHSGTTLTLQLPPAKLLPVVVAVEFYEMPAINAASDIRQRLDGSVVLTANHANLRTAHADGKPVLFLSPDACGGRILGWRRKEDYLEWTFRINRAGSYRPSFEFNNPESLNCYARRLEIAVAGQSLHASVPMSGRHGRFDLYSLAGAFRLSSGEYTLTIKPTMLDPGILMNFRAVVLDRVPRVSSTTELHPACNENVQD